jgi:hypothetical protein
MSGDRLADRPLADSKPGTELRQSSTWASAWKLTGISYPLLTNTYHEGRGSDQSRAHQQALVG